MRSRFVVLLAPIFDLPDSVVQIQEPMLAKALETDAGVEALGVAIVDRLAWRLKSSVTLLA